MTKSTHRIEDEIAEVLMENNKHKKQENPIKNQQESETNPTDNGIPTLTPKMYPPYTTYNK